MEHLNKLSSQIVDAAFQVHQKLGPGLMERVYQACLVIELEKKNLDVKKEVFLPVVYDSRVIDIGYRIDLLVESEIILGFLINFNVPLIKDGIKRIIN